MVSEGRSVNTLYANASFFFLEMTIVKENNIFNGAEY